VDVAMGQIPRSTERISSCSWYQCLCECISGTPSMSLLMISWHT